ncbi:WAPL (Wings apart-like protein regulation of heterochromatin) protein [Zea mays]|uniref:WAPL (Wings apart-like protein regulation of heterochromatin) protein n=1 Tax=Zea mays TaxID=4577 RepID=A0A1D6FEB7_MAIZE|nr:WAPL (Wings apart-like protein regulation of heterochromatin) protein [Zea mays]
MEPAAEDTTSAMPNSWETADIDAHMSRLILSACRVSSPLDLAFSMKKTVQDNNLLSSETCVHFLLKLLNPPVNVVDAKAPSIEDILSKVEEIFLSCKEIKPADRDYKRTTRPELCSKWLALLTMEKACLSVVALEDTSDMVLELGGNFKETLRQLGGLDDIFNVMVNCHSELEIEGCSKVTLMGILAFFLNCNPKFKSLSLSKCIEIKDICSAPAQLPECKSLQSLAIKDCSGFTDTNLPMLACSALSWRTSI